MGYLLGKVLLGMEVDERGLLERKPWFAAPSTLLRGEVWFLPQNSSASFFPPLSSCFALDPGILPEKPPFCTLNFVCLRQGAQPVQL